MDAGRQLPAAALSSGPTPASKVVFVWGNRLFCGQWREEGLDFPGGKSELAETPCDCAQRELKEEVNIGAHALARLSQLRVPRATFLMELAGERRYRVSIFVVYLTQPEVALTKEGSRELSSPAWLEVPEILTDLSFSRVPLEAGRAYAVALLVALR